MRPRSSHDHLLHRHPDRWCDFQECTVSLSAGVRRASTSSAFRAADLSIMRLSQKSARSTPFGVRRHADFPERVASVRYPSFLRPLAALLTSLFQAMPDALSSV